MKMTIIGKNMEVSDKLKARLEKKLGKLDRFFADDTPMKVTLSEEKNRQIIEVTIPFDGVILRGEESGSDMFTAIDKVVDVLIRQIRKHRTRLEKRVKSGSFIKGAPLEADDAFTADEPGDELGKVVRVKQFDMKPMTVEEAALQMDLLGHTFYVFCNGDTGKVNVVYKRKDGNLGFIEPA